MAIHSLLSALALRPLINKSCADPGRQRPEDVLPALANLLRERDSGLTPVLRQAGVHAWKALEAILAGESFWNGCRVFLNPVDYQALHEHMPQLRERAGWHGPPRRQREEQRHACLSELQAARKAGLLTQGTLDESTLLEQVAPLAHPADPRRLTDREWQLWQRLVGQLRDAGLSHLTEFLELGRREDMPLLVAAARFAFRSEAESCPPLPGPLAVPEDPGVALLVQVMAKHGRGLQEWLDDDPSEPLTPQELHAHASPAEKQGALGESASPAPGSTWQEAETPASSAGAGPCPQPPPSPATPIQGPLSRRQRLWGWLLPLLGLALPMVLVVWLVNRYSVSELRHFSGHTDLVTSVAFAPDGHRAVSGSVDKTVRVWDLDNGQEVMCLTSHAGPVKSVAISPDGRRILSGGLDALRLWDVATGQELRQLPTPTNFILSVAFSPDSRYALSTSQADTKVRLWDVETAREIRQFEGHTAKVYAAAFAPDGQRLVSGSADGTVRLWDVATGKELRRFEGHGDEVKCVAFAPDGKRIASGSADRTVRLWDVATGKELCRFEGHSSWVLSVAFAPDGSQVLSGSVGLPEAGAVTDRRTLRIWDAASGREAYHIEDSESAVWSAVISPDGHAILSGGADKDVRLWQLPN